MDSNANFMPSATIGASYEIIDRISLGLEVGIASRIIYLTDDNQIYYGNSERMIIPILLPKLEIDLDRIMINLAYIPPIDSSIKITQAVYINFGIPLNY